LKNLDLKGPATKDLTSLKRKRRKVYISREPSQKKSRKKDSTTFEERSFLGGESSNNNGTPKEKSQSKSCTKRV